MTYFGLDVLVGVARGVADESIKVQEAATRNIKRVRRAGYRIRRERRPVRQIRRSEMILLEFQAILWQSSSSRMNHKGGSKRAWLSCTSLGLMVLN